MKFSPRQRWTVLLVCLAAVLAAGLAIDDEAAEEAAPRKRTRNATASTAGAAPERAPLAATDGNAAIPEGDGDGNGVDSGEKGEAGDTPLDPFRTKSWQPPPPPPPKPGAPPLPFKYLGKSIAGDQQRFFIARNDTYLTTSVGDVLDGQYLFEKAERGRLVFLYQPLKERQFLAITVD